MYNYFIYRSIDKDCTPINSQWMLSLISIIKSQFHASENMSQWLLHNEKELSHFQVNKASEFK